MRKLILCTIGLMAFTLSAQYYQGFDVKNKKWMEDSCWVFVNSDINGSIGNNMNYRTDKLTSVASLTSPWYVFDNGSVLSFPFRTTHAGDSMQLWLHDEYGNSFKYKTYICKDTYVLVNVTFSAAVNYKIEWRFMTAPSDFGYIDYIKISSGYFNTDTGTCNPIVLLPIEDNTPTVQQSKTDEQFIDIQKNTINVNADDYTITLFDMSLRTIQFEQNHPLVVKTPGIYIVSVVYADEVGTKICKNFKVQCE